MIATVYVNDKAVYFVTRMKPATDKEPGDHCMGLRGLCSDRLGPLPGEMVVRCYGQLTLEDSKGKKHIIKEMKTNGLYHS